MNCGGSEEKAAPSPGSETGTLETGAGKSSNPLAGTNWQLLEIQSMDDSVGTVKPDDPSLYTMSLRKDGTVAMRLNCSRTNGTWGAEPGGDSDSGRFEFGPLATTAALCPSPSLDERIANDAGYVRSFLLRDGRLYLSLMADGGIYAWEPLVDEPYQTEPDAELEAAILAASPSYTRELIEAGGGTVARYIYGTVDLNGDDKSEVFCVSAVGRRFGTLLREACF